MKPFPESEYTAIKQEHFRKIIKKHINICSAIFPKHPGRTDGKYWYFDLNAGVGFTETSLGSPLIFLKEVEQYKFPVRTALFELEKCWYNHLKTSIDLYNHGVLSNRVQCEIYNGDNNQLFGEYYRSGQKDKRLGLIYNDPFGIPQFDLLAKISKLKCYSMNDILINCPSTAIKRARNSPTTYTERSLVESLRPINRSFWLIREPYGPQQWTMLIGSNWPYFPEFSGLGFYKLQSSRGQELLNLFNYTKKEMMNGDQ